MERKQSQAVEALQISVSEVDGARSVKCQRCNSDVRIPTPGLCYLGVYHKGHGPKRITGLQTRIKCVELSISKWQRQRSGPQDAKARAYKAVRRIC